MFNAMVGAFVGRLLATIFIAICLALGFGPDSWAKVILGIDPTLVARGAFVILGAIVAFILWLQWSKREPVSAGSSTHDLMNKLQRGEFEFLYPPLPGEYRRPDGHLSLKEAATRAYEQTRGSAAAEIAERMANGPNDILEWYGTALTLAANRKNGDKPLMTLFGVRPPSRISERIDIQKSYILSIGAKDSVIAQSSRIVFENLTVAADALSEAIEKLKD